MIQDLDNLPVVEALEISWQEPDQILPALERAGDSELWILCRFNAYSSKALAPFMEAGLQMYGAATEFNKVKLPNTVELCENAVNEIVKIEQEKTELFYLTSDMFLERETDSRNQNIGKKQIADGVCAALNRMKPGRVQEIRGLTKLSYFDSDQQAIAEVNCDPIQFMGFDTMDKLLDIPFVLPSIARSFLLTGLGNQSNALKNAKYYVFSNAFSARDPKIIESANNASFGMVTLVEDGTYLFQQ